MHLYRVVLGYQDNYGVHGAITAIIISARDSDTALKIARQEFPNMVFAYAVVDNSTSVVSTN